jgi:hypothetical protein
MKNNTYEVRYQLPDKGQQFQHVEAVSEQAAIAAIILMHSGNAFNLYAQHVPALATQEAAR